MRRELSSTQIGHLLRHRMNLKDSRNRGVRKCQKGNFMYDRNNTVNESGFGDFVRTEEKESMGVSLVVV